jgi:hypothetical protein
VGHRAHVGAAFDGGLADMKLLDVMRVRLCPAAAGRFYIRVLGIGVCDPDKVMLGGRYRIHRQSGALRDRQIQHGHGGACA